MGEIIRNSFIALVKEEKKEKKKKKTWKIFVGKKILSDFFHLASSGITNYPFYCNRFRSFRDICQILLLQDLKVICSYIRITLYNNHFRYRLSGLYEICVYSILRVWHVCIKIFSLEIAGGDIVLISNKF